MDIMTDFKKAHELLKEFKGNNYHFGTGILDQIGDMTRVLGKRVIFIHGKRGISEYFQLIQDSLKRAGIEVVVDIYHRQDVVPGEGPRDGR